jgi:hypothetical protein
MSRVTIAFASFMLGVATSFVLFTGSQASILAQAQAPSPQSPSQQNTPLGPIIAGGAGMPAVPPITQHFTDFGLSDTLPFGVDGSECVRCTFANSSLRYGGGNFQFTDFKFSGPVRVELVGAARNTVVFLDFVQRLAAGQAPPRPTKPPNTTLIKTATVKDTVTGSFGTNE